jgi:hypothetical protein
MYLKVMKQLGLKTTCPYGNVCGIDSKKVKVYGLIEDVEVYLEYFPHIGLLMNIVVIDVPNAWGMLLSRSWAATLGGFLSMDLTHAHIPMGDGTFEILYNREVSMKHVLDQNDPDYSSKDDFDEAPDTIEYDPRDLPFMQEDCIDTLLPRTNEYKENLAKFQGKESGSIKILKKEEDKRDKEHEKVIKDMVNAEPPSYPYIENIPYINFSEGSLALMWDKRKGKSQSMIKRVMSYGLALTSSRRSLRREATTCLPWMGERCHYQSMGLFSDPMFKEPDFFRAQAPGK